MGEREPLEPTAIYTGDGATVVPTRFPRPSGARAALSLSKKVERVTAAAVGPLAAASLLGVGAAAIVRSGAVLSRVVHRPAEVTRRVSGPGGRESWLPGGGPAVAGLVQVSWTHVEIRWRYL